MQLKDAIELIDNSYIRDSEKQVWSELGCGTGTFTAALANLLPAESIIYAVDNDRSALKKIPGEINKVSIEKINADFTRDEFPFGLNGILIANSLHYVKEKELFVGEMINHIKKEGCIIIAEYDTEKSNQWIPFPISFNSLRRLFEKMGFNVKKLKEKPSVYRKENIYSALVYKGVKTGMTISGRQVKRHPESSIVHPEIDNPTLRFLTSFEMTL